MLAGRFNARNFGRNGSRRVATAHTIAVPSMANTYTELLYHCIWSTKNREPLIRQEIEESVWAILASVATRHQLHIRRAGGIDNHVHVLIDIPKTVSVSEAMKQLKGGSSNAINQEGLMKAGRFSWQDGYAAFTVSASNAAQVVRYIASQREHHRHRSFEEELVALLEKHRVAYDPKYLWD